MNVLFVDYIKKDDAIQHALAKTTLNYHIVNSYDEFIDIYNKKNYDLCVLFINDTEEVSFLMHYMVQHNTSQKVLYVKHQKDECYFQHNCKLCHEFELKSMTYDSNDTLIDAIENFESLVCEYKKG